MLASCNCLAGGVIDILFSLCSLRTQRVRDPIHDLMVFSEKDPIDVAAWELLNTREVQRLRRVRQLGVSEFIYPSATHTRFAHSVGVFHLARRLIEIVRREINEGRVQGEQFNEHRANVALMAALLHDIGHGPFSHAFEEARKSIAIKQLGKDAGKLKKHEAFTAELILAQDSQISGILEKVGVSADEVAELIRSENPVDMYHAVVSSSFDADRLDYLQRDRYMTGTGSGAIDIDWLLDNVRVAEIDVSPPEEGSNQSIYTYSFCLGHKARDAAEDFLLARYRLYANVYFHKTTRGIEQLVAAFFAAIADRVNSQGNVPGLPDSHPLVQFFAKDGETLANYRSLDDSVVIGAMHEVARLGGGAEADFARKFLYREKMFCLDLQNEFPEMKEENRKFKHAIDAKFKDSLGFTVFKDEAKLSIYGEIGADDSRAQKRLMIQLPNRSLREITDFADATIQASTRQRNFERYYFVNHADFKSALDMATEIRGKHHGH